MSFVSPGRLNFGGGHTLSAGCARTNQAYAVLLI